MMKRTMMTVLGLLALMVGGSVMAQVRIQPAPGGPAIGRPIGAPVSMKVDWPYSVNLYASRMQNDKGSLRLRISTTKRYKSGGYSLNVTSKVDGKKVAIKIAGVSSPKGGVRTMAFAPASAMVNVPSLPDSYEIAVTADKTTESLQLTVDYGTITLKSTGKTKLFGTVNQSFLVPPENAFGLTIIPNKRAEGPVITGLIRKEIESLPGVKTWEPKKGRYLCAGSVYKNANNTYYTMDKKLDWDAISKVVQKYKGNVKMYVMAIATKDGRTVRNR